MKAGRPTIPEDALERIDKFAVEQGYTGFLLHAATRAISAAKTKGERSEAGPADRRSGHG
jgi:hypothetical protein